MISKPEFGPTTAADSRSAHRWMTGLAAGAAGVAGLGGLDEAYGAVITLDNGGAGWTLNQPAYGTGTVVDYLYVDIGSPGSAAFSMFWYNDSIGAQAGLEGYSLGNAFQRNVASATPGTSFGFGSVSFIRNDTGALQNGAQIGPDNWLPISLTDFGINGGVQTFGWMQLDLQPTSHSILAFYYSDTGAVLHLDGAGGVEEQGVPEPGSLALLAAGAGGIAALRRRRRRS